MAELSGAQNNKSLNIGQLSIVIQQLSDLSADIKKADADTKKNIGVAKSILNTLSKNIGVMVDSMINVYIQLSKEVEGEGVVVDLNTLTADKIKSKFSGFQNLTKSIVEGINGVDLKTLNQNVPDISDDIKSLIKGGDSVTGKLSKIVKAANEVRDYFALKEDGTLVLNANKKPIDFKKYELPEGFTDVLDTNISSVFDYANGIINALNNALTEEKTKLTPLDVNTANIDLLAKRIRGGEKTADTAAAQTVSSVLNSLVKNANIVYSTIHFSNDDLYGAKKGGEVPLFDGVGIKNMLNDKNNELIKGKLSANIQAIIKYTNSIIGGINDGFGDGSVDGITENAAAVVKQIENAISDSSTFNGSDLKRGAKFIISEIIKQGNNLVNAVNQIYIKGTNNPVSLDLENQITELDKIYNKLITSTKDVFDKLNNQQFQQDIDTAALQNTLAYLDKYINGEKDSDIADWIAGGDKFPGLKIIIGTILKYPGTIIKSLCNTDKTTGETLKVSDADIKKISDGLVDSANYIGELISWINMFTEDIKSYKIDDLGALQTMMDILNGLNDPLKNFTSSLATLIKTLSEDVLPVDTKTITDNIATLADNAFALIESIQNAGDNREIPSVDVVLDRLDQIGNIIEAVADRVKLISDNIKTIKGNGVDSAALTQIVTDMNNLIDAVHQLVGDVSGSIKLFLLLPMIDNTIYSLSLIMSRLSSLEVQDNTDKLQTCINEVLLYKELLDAFIKLPVLRAAVVSKSVQLTLGFIKNALENISQIQDYTKNFETTVNMIRGFSELIEILSEIKSGKVARNILLLQKSGVVQRVVDLLTAMGSLKTDRMPSIRAGIEAIKDLSKLLTEIEKLKVTNLYVKVIMLRSAISQINKLLEMMGNTNLSGSSAADMKDRVSVLNQLVIMMGMLESMKLNKAAYNVKRMHKLMPLINNMMTYIAEMEDTYGAEKKIKNATRAVLGIGQLLIAILVIAPMAAMFILLSGPIVICFWLFSKIVNIIVHVIARAITPMAFLAITRLVVLVGMLLLLAAAILLLAAIAPDMLKAVILLGGFFLALAGILLMMAGFGYIVTLMTPLLAPALYGVAVVGVAVLAILAIAAMLWMIQKIELEPDAIKANVEIIIGTAMSIIALVFQGMADPRTGGGVADIGFLKLIGGAIANVVGALASCAILVITTLSVFAILMIAAMLWAVQKIELDKNAIAQNIQTILDIVHQLVNGVFANWSTPEAASSRGALGSLIAWISPQMANVLDAIFAMMFLVVSTISIGSILLIAGMLRLLQTLNLNEDKIKENVDTVINTVRSIINILFQQDDKDGGTKRGVLGMLFDLFYPPLGAVVDALMSMAYLFLMTISVACVFGIAAMLKQLGEMDMDKIQRGGENAKNILDTVRNLINTIMYPDDKGDTASPRRGMMALVGKFFPGVANILEAIFSVGYLALMFIGIACIKGIANSLIELANIDEKTINTAKDNAVKVVGAARQIMSQIFQRENEENTKTNKSWLQKLLEWTGIADIKEVIDAIMNIGKLAILIVGIGSIAKLADQMKQIAEAKIDSKAVTDKGANIVNAASTIFNSIRTKLGEVDDDAVEDAFDKLKPMTKVFEQLSKVATSMGSMSKVQLRQGVLTGFTNVFVTETQQSFSRLNTSLPVDLTNQVQQNIQRTNAVLDRLRQLVNKYASMGSDGLAESLQRSTQNQLNAWESMRQIFAAIEQTNVDDTGVRQRLELLDRISLSIKRFAKVNDADVKNSRAIVDNYIRFIDRVDKSQIAKLKTTEQLMKHWADLSRSINGDFEGLSKTINEHILPAIKKLDETMRGVTKTQQEIIDLMKQDEMADMMNTGTGGVGAAGGSPMMTAPTAGGGDMMQSGDNSSISTESIAGATLPQKPVNNAGVANPPQKTVKSNRTNRSNSSRASEYEISTALADIAKAIRGN